MLQGSYLISAMWKSEELISNQLLEQIL